MRWLILALLLMAMNASAQSIRHRLTWQGPSEVISGYKVYRSLGTNVQFYMMLATTNQTASFTNNTPDLYRYRVTSYNSFGESLPSNEVMVDMRTPKNPTNLTLNVEIIIVTPPSSTPP